MSLLCLYICIFGAAKQVKQSVTRNCEFCLQWLLVTFIIVCLISGVAYGNCKDKHHVVGSGVPVSHYLPRYQAMNMI